MKPDERILRNVLNELRYEPMLRSADIQVNVSGRIVKLSGTVNDFYKMIIAENAVSRVSGVKGIISEVNVRIDERLYAAQLM